MTQLPPTNSPQLNPDGQPARTFADHMVAYAQAGWPCVLPVPPATKTPPPTGFTGADGRDTDPLQLVAWSKSHADYSIALRMPDGVIGIDVDTYAKGQTAKQGATTLASFEQQWGPLPPTWASTARGSAQGPGESRILFFRVPAQRYAANLSDGVTGDVEIIQRHHRYAVVWPSPHPGAGEGAFYRWYDPSGTPVDAPPNPAHLAELPATWVQGLADGASAGGPASADRRQGADLLEQVCEDYTPECAELTSVRLYAVDLMRRSEAGTRHDVMNDQLMHIVMVASAGHAGGGHAVAEMRHVWQTITASEGRESEFEESLLGAARKAVTAYGPNRVPRDPCLMITGFPGIPGARTTYDGGGQAGAAGESHDPDQETELQIHEPPRWGGVREAIGAHAFDTNAGLDQPLAERVLERVYPALRYAYDANAWLLRAPDRWEVHGRLSTWAVATVAPLMPVGDTTADKDSEQYARSQRRSRLMSTAGARAVAGKMDDLVAGGMHPAAVALGSLDADPEILWAGSMPYAIRGSIEGPAFADIDPATPHIRTAGVTPDARATPLWDAFLTAVWPDPAIRAWAIRVLSIAVTGYADRALPILLGETGRGKTQVVHLMMSVLGTYAHAANPKLLGSGTNEHDTIIYDLKGRRLSFIDEGPSERKAGQERLKQLTGGGDLTGRQMNQDPVTFPTTHTLVLTANDEPSLTDPAVRSRVRLIPCDGDPDLVRRTRGAIGPVAGTAWRAEAPGVLALLMSEAAAWLANPDSAMVTAAPESIAYLAERMGAEQDPVTTWVSEETEVWPAGTASRELYQAFHQSCRNSGTRLDMIPSETKWGHQLNRLGFPSEHTRSGKIRRLRVRPYGFVTPLDPSDPSVTTVTGLDPATRHSPEAMPPVPPAAWPTSPERDGLARFGDGLVTGQNGYPSQAFPQVNPSESVSGDGCDGSNTSFTHVRTPARPQESLTGLSPVTRHDPPADPSDDAAGKAPAKPKRQRSAEATAKAAALREEKRQAAIAEVAGPLVELPAVVTRDGQVRACGATDADALLRTITSAGAALTVDVEHTGYPVGHEHYALRTVQLGNAHLALVLDPTDQAQAQVIRTHVAAAAALHAHSAAADLVPLAVDDLLSELGEPNSSAGLERAWAKTLDTGLLAKLSDPSSTGNDADLKGLAKNVLGTSGPMASVSPAAEEARKALFKAGKWLTDTEVTTPVERSGWAQVDPRSETMVRYAASDVLDCAALAAVLPRPEPAVLERELLAQRMTARVTYRGIRLDGTHVQAKLDEHRAARTEHAEQVRTMTEHLGDLAVDNPGSNDQIAKALDALGARLPRTRTGKLSVAKGVLEPLADDEAQVGELVRAVLGYRHHNTALVLLLEPYNEIATRGDGRARPTVYTLGADTGRMSSSRPNVQQVSREGGMRACFTADPGYVMVSADFASVEIRVAAALSQDPSLLQMLREDRDMHAEIARLVWGPDYTKAHRYKAKRKVFGRIYGQGLEGMANTDGAGPVVAQAVIDAMDTLTPGLTGWSANVSNGVKAGHTQFTSYSGRVIHMPKDAPHAAPNYCIQGTARELLIDALVRWSETPWGDCTLFPVHDELVVFVPEADAEAATAALVQCMTSEIRGVQIVAEASEPSFEWKDSA